MGYKWNVNDLENFVKNSTSIRNLLFNIGLKPAGGNYIQVKKLIKEKNIDISHFTGQGYLKNKKHDYNKKDLSYYLVHSENQLTTSHNLKNRLIKEKIFEHKCYDCGLNKWKNNKIPLELHHIDGNRTNNKLNNLLLLCPNCHALTDNYRGKNKGVGH